MLFRSAVPAARLEVMNGRNSAAARLPCTRLKALCSPNASGIATKCCPIAVSSAIDSERHQPCQKIGSLSVYSNAHNPSKRILSSPLVGFHSINDTIKESSSGKPANSICKCSDIADSCVILNQGDIASRLSYD